MSVRTSVRLIAVSALVALAAACAPSTNSEGGGDTASGDKTKLTVWSWRTEDVAAYRKIFSIYEKDHPGTTVEFKPFKNTEYNTILATGLTEAGGPDVAQLRSYGGLQPLIEAGNLVPLDGTAGLSDFEPSALEGAKGRTDGKVYGVPFATQTLQVFYNKKIFADNGITVPTTWSQLTAAADKLQEAGITPFATTGKETWMLPILHDTFAAPRYGGADFAKAVQSGQKNFTDADYVASIDVVKSLEKYFPKDVAGVAYTDAQVLFTTDKAAMYPGGSFELGFFQAQAPDLDLGVFSAPPPDGSPVDHALVPGYTDGSYGINTKSKHQKAAKELVTWMATQQFGQLVSDELKQISTVPGVAPKDPLLAEMASNYAQNPTPYLLLVDFRYGDPSGTDLLGAGVQSMLLGKSDPQQVAASLQKGVSQWFKPKA
ncbi:MAG: raffinose/stachyose/melibiose transport system substrate-binding protein [Actinomycetota bacterium]|nr:raffinose/stachyose/melibiose transport system substrate-binding protein [Actinomycetota bacterium]